MPKSKARPRFPSSPAHEAGFGPSVRRALSHPCSAGLLLAALTLAAYWSALTCDFSYYDDTVYVTDNRHVLQGLSWEGVDWAFTNLAAGFWHPLTWLSHMLDCQLYGLHPWGHHLTNLLLHIASTLVLFGVWRRATGYLWRSAVVAGLFAVHPLHVEAVAWVAERKELLCALFGFLSLWCYVRYVRDLQSSQSSARSQESGIRGQESGGRRQKSEVRSQRVEGPASALSVQPAAFLQRRWYALALVCFALGLMSKTMLVTLPLVLLLMDFWPLGRGARGEGRGTREKESALKGEGQKRAHNWQLAIGNWKWLVLEKAPFFALSLVCGLLTIYAEKKVGALPTTAQLPVLARVANGLVSLVYYLGQMVWPANLAVFYPYPKTLPLSAVAGAAVLLLGISVAALWLGRRWPYLLAGWFWYLITLAPVSGLVQVGPHARADRYTYVPLIGIFVLAVWGVSDLWSRWRLPKTLLGTLAVGMLAACGFLTRGQLRYWRDAESLFSHALAVTKDNYLAYNNVGYYLMSTYGRADEAIADFRAAIAINAKCADALDNLGYALSLKGELESAIGYYRAALEVTPENANALNNLGNALANQGKGDEAIEAYRHAVKSKPDYAEGHNNLGIALTQKGQFEAATAEFQAALFYKPDYPVALNSLGNIFVLQHDYAKAIPQYTQALRFKADYPEAHNNLGFALMELGQLEASLPHYREALRLNPDYAQAHCNLGLALSRLGRREEAVAELHEAVRLQPAHAEARQKLQELGAPVPP